MAKLKDGFYKQTAEAIGSDLYVLLAGGGMKPLADFATSTLDGVATEDWVSKNYLALSGGTISNSVNTPLTINTTSTVEVGLRLSMGGAGKGWLGYTPNIGIYLYSYGTNGQTHKLGISDIGVGFLDSNTLIHSGNIGNYALTSLPDHSHTYLPLAGGLMTDAATIQWGNNKTTWDNVPKGFIGISNTSADATLGYYAGLSFKGYYGMQLRNYGGGNSLEFRGHNSSNWQPWVTIITSSNYNSYSPTLSGVGATGTWGINISGSAATATLSDKNKTINITASEFKKAQYSGFYNVTNSTSDAPLPDGGSGGHVAIHAAWDNGANTAGLDLLINDSTESHLYFRARVGGGGIGTWKTLLDSSNYNSYAPTLTGTGASGTWGINISGSAANADTLDGYHEDSFLRYRDVAYTDGTATLWSQIGIRSYHGALPEGLSGLYNYGQVVSLPGNGSRLDIFTNHIGSSQSNGSGGLWWRSGWNTEKHAWQRIIDSGNIGSQSVNYANSAGNADTVDNLHASSLVKFYLSPMTSSAPADSAKSWFTDTMPSGSGAIVYNVPGSEKTIIAGKSTGSYGHMLQLNYDDTYLRILRYFGGSWKSTDWEKISAGYADSAGRASYLSGHSSNPDNSHPGHGARVFYSWDTGQAGSATSGYSNGITIGSHPNDTAYGFQIVQNMWDDRTYTRRYNGGWQSWKTLAWTSDIPTVTDYYWADQRITSSAVYTASPTLSSLRVQGSGGSRATIYMVSASDVPNDLWFGAGGQSDWSLTSRNSSEGRYFGLYNNSLGWAFTVDKSNNRFKVSEWIQFDSSCGLYWPNAYGAHFYPNETSTYGQFTILGSKNSYSGIHFGNSKNYLTVMSTDTHHGLYCENYGWEFYFNRSNSYIGLRSSSTPYPISMSGDSYTTGWSRAASGFYVEGTGVHYTSQSSVGEIDMTSNNEFLWGSSSADLYFNYRTVSRGTTVTNYIWNAGSSSSYATHTMGLTYFRGSGKYLRIGPQNGSHAHYETDASSHWFNKKVQVQGDIYGGSSYNRRLAYCDEIYAYALPYNGWWNSGSGQNVNNANGMTFVYGDHGSPNGWGILCTFDYTYNSSYKFQLFAEGYSAAGMYYRCRSADRGGWTSWKTVIDSGNIGSQSVNYANSAGSASYASAVGINYSNDSNSTYQMLWGSGNYVYGTGGIYCNPSTDYMYANSFNCGDWFRSSGSSGWYNPTYECHVYPNNLSTYGGLILRGIKGGYHGFLLGPGSGYMNLMDNGTDKGLYQESQGMWILYYNKSNGRVSIRTSSTTKDFNVSGTSYLSNKTWIGTTSGNEMLNVGGWVGTIGDTGWYNSTYAGGVYMSDTTWVRIYNGKKFYVSNGSADAIHSAGGVYVAGAVHAYANYLKSTCNGKTITIGSRNALWCHYETSAPAHWFNVAIYSAGGFYEYSDETLKDFHDDIKVDFEKLKTIPKKYFNFKTTPDKIEIGTSAQAVQSIYPEFVHKNADNTLGVDYGKLSVLALKGIDELYDMILELREENRLLKEELKQVKTWQS